MQFIHNYTVLRHIYVFVLFLYNTNNNEPLSSYFLRMSFQLTEGRSAESFVRTVDCHDCDVLTLALCLYDKKKLRENPWG